MPVDERDLQAALAPGALAATAAATATQGPRLYWPEGSSDSLSSGGSGSDESVYKVLLLGAPGVGKSALARIFGGVEDGPDAEAAGEGMGLLQGRETPWLGQGAVPWDSKDALRIMSLFSHFKMRKLREKGLYQRPPHPSATCQPLVGKKCPE
jgi:hypothetical protein